MHLHVFLNGENVTPQQVKNSHTASARIRLSPFIEFAQMECLSITIGNYAPANTTVGFVAKIGGPNYEKLQKHWINQLRSLAADGHPLVLDYSDHHLAFSSPIKPFYSEAVKICTDIVTPTAELTEDMKVRAIGKKCHTVHDMVEYPRREPGRNPSSGEIKAMWFGHPSNANFLARYIDEHGDAMSGQHLTVISTQATVRVLNEYTYTKRPSLRLRFVPWSREAVFQCAKASDYCVIPSDNESYKQFASNNRLVTALALGLPTIATTIGSYREFSDFFADENSPQALEVTKNPRILHEKIIRFQEERLDGFTKENIIKLWRSLKLL